MSDLVADVLANPAVGMLGTAIAVSALALWLAAAWWAYSDASRRTETSLAGFAAAGWILLSTPLMLPLSLAVYALARPQVAAGDRRVRSLVEQLGVVATGPVCQTCSSPVEDAWLRCPTCTVWLASPCAACGRWSESSLELCPWCGDEARTAPYVEDLVPALAPAQGSARVSAITKLTPEAVPAAAERRPRIGWRITGPAPSRSQSRGEQRRAAAGFEGRRLARSRSRA